MLSERQTMDGREPSSWHREPKAVKAAKAERRDVGKESKRRSRKDRSTERDKVRKTSVKAGVHGMPQVFPAGFVIPSTMYQPMPAHMMTMPRHLMMPGQYMMMPPSGLAYPSHNFYRPRGATPSKDPSGPATAVQTTQLEDAKTRCKTEPPKENKRSASASSSSSSSSSSSFAGGDGAPTQKLATPPSSPGHIAAAGAAKEQSPHDEENEPATEKGALDGASPARRVPPRAPEAPPPWAPQSPDANPAPAASRSPTPGDEEDEIAMALQQASGGGWEEVRESRTIEELRRELEEHRECSCMETQTEGNPHEVPEDCGERWFSGFDFALSVPATAKALSSGGVASVGEGEAATATRPGRQLRRRVADGDASRSRSRGPQSNPNSASSRSSSASSSSSTCSSARRQRVTSSEDEGPPGGAVGGKAMGDGSGPQGSGTDPSVAVVDLRMRGMQDYSDVM